MTDLFFRSYLIILMALTGLMVLIADIRMRAQSGHGALRLPDIKRLPVFSADCVFWLAIAGWVLTGTTWFYNSNSRLDYLPISESLNIPVQIFGLVIGVAGLFYITAGVFTLGMSFRTSIDFGEKAQLITSGIYRHCRNPMALGLILLGWATALLHQTFFAILVALVLHLTNRMRVHFEEKYLTIIIGERYTEFCGSTGRFFTLPYRKRK